MMVTIAETATVSWDGLLIAGSVLVATVGAVWRISAVINKVVNRLQRAEREIVELQKDHCGMSQMCELALRSAILNPDMAVPDPRDPSRSIQVNRDEEDTQ